MKNSKWVLLVAAVIVLGVFSCKKGDTGPAGPAGTAGAAGPAGPAGPDSIMTSSWVILQLTDTTINSNPYFVQEIPAPAITASILDGGIILSYFGYLDNNGVENIFNASEGANITYSPGNIEVLYGGEEDFISGLAFRYVIVPGTMTVGNTVASGPAKGLSKSDLQKMNYQDVQKLLGSSKAVTQ